MFLSLLSCLLLLQPQVHESGNLNHNLVLPGGVYLPPTSCRSVSSPAAESGWPVFVESKSTSQAHSVHYKANLSANACRPGPVSTPTAQHGAIDGTQRGLTAERPGVRSATVASGNARRQVWCCQTLQVPGISPNQTPGTGPHQARRIGPNQKLSTCPSQGLLLKRAHLAIGSVLALFELAGIFEPHQAEN